MKIRLPHIKIKIWTSAQVLAINLNFNAIQTINAMSSPKQKLTFGWHPLTQIFNAIGHNGQKNHQHYDLPKQKSFGFTFQSKKNIILLDS